MEVTELKIVRWALGVSKKDKIRHEYVRGIAKIAEMGDKLRDARLQWCGHVKKREEGYVGTRMMEMAVPGRRKRERPSVAFSLFEVAYSATPNKEKPKEEERLWLLVHC